MGLATAIAVLDIFFILVAVPESLPEKPLASRPGDGSWSSQITWEQADPFAVSPGISSGSNQSIFSVSSVLQYIVHVGSDRYGNLLYPPI